MKEVLDKVFEVLGNLFEAREGVLGRISTFLFEDLGIPFDLFVLTLGAVVIFSERRGIEAWWRHKKRRRNYRPNRELSDWENMESYQQAYIRSSMFGATILLLVGLWALLSGFPNNASP